MNILLQAKGLVKKYGKRKTAVDGIDIEVRKGEIVGIIGPNGAGKSTTLDLLLGLKKPDGGGVSYGWSRPRRHIGVQLQATPFFPGLSASEHLKLFAALYGVRLDEERIGAILKQCGLGEAAQTAAGKLSSGQQKRLAIAIALAHGPELIFLDEPAAALDPRARQEVRDLLKSLADAGTAIVFTSHDMEEVAKIAQRVIVIAGGRTIAEGTPEELCEANGTKSLEDLYMKVTDAAYSKGDIA